ncbi:MAG: hypothetical protein WBK94_07580 [Tenuifilaceae bacterium]
MVTVAFPTANTQRANATLARWRAMGYASMVLIDAGMERPRAGRVIEADPYPGFAAAANILCHQSGADWTVVAGDDIDPDPRLTPDEIAHQLRQHFGGTFGVCQPTGDAYGALAPNAPHPAAVSPWIGREFIQRAYGGLGPYWTSYRHLFADTELYSVAQRMGVLLLRPDITQYHAHWGRGHEDTLPVAKRRRISESQRLDMELYEQRKAQGFPGAI